MLLGVQFRVQDGDLDTLRLPRDLYCSLDELSGFSIVNYEDYRSRQPEWTRSGRDEHHTVRKPSLGHFAGRVKVEPVRLLEDKTVFHCGNCRYSSPISSSFSVDPGT